jgi:protein SCO1/2
VRWSDFDGKYRVLYFGYAYCPDVCPLDVQRLMQGYAGSRRPSPELAAQSSRSSSPSIRRATRRK